MFGETEEEKGSIECITVKHDFGKGMEHIEQVKTKSVLIINTGYQYGDQETINLN